MITRKLTFQAIGTAWEIQAHSDISDMSWADIQADIQKRISLFDETYSRFREDSLVSRMSVKPGKYKMPPDGFKLMSFYDKLYKSTDGSVTPLIGQTLVDAGYDAKYSLKVRKLSSPPQWDGTIEYNRQYLTLRQPVLLDFGAAGKGYLVDIISDLISSAGVSNYIINASGDILHHGSNGQINVGLENPDDDTEVVGEVALNNKSLCASSGSRRQWGKYHHIINPTTLESPTDIIATWVIADDTMTADGLATALFFEKPAKLKEDFEFAHARLFKDMSMERSGDFPSSLYMADGQ